MLDEGVGASIRERNGDGGGGYGCGASAARRKYVNIGYLISASGVRLQSDGVVGATTSFAGVLLA
ncbi:hypothetical protein ACG0Z4_04970 [Enterocloster aldenensis]|uniref:hypothetical protein n=1 Tax=Enterocloster aldenensis TaxID=358742 RepID=UPI0040254049